MDDRRRQDRGRHARADRSATPPGSIYFVKFDPPSNPEMASGAEVISTKFFHAFGYHVPENYLATLRRESLVIGDGAQVADEDGKPAAMRPAGRRGGAGKVGAQRGRQLSRARQQGAAPGRRSGPSATTARGRTIRTTSSRTSTAASCAGCGVFAAWLNHDDSRSINTLDTLVARRRPHRRASPPDRLRLDARQRQHAGADRARRQRVRLGIAADDHHDADPRASTCGRG